MVRGILCPSGFFNQKCGFVFDVDVSKPRYVRVNSLKMDVHSAMLELGKEFKVLSDTFMIF